MDLRPRREYLPGCQRSDAGTEHLSDSSSEEDYCDTGVESVSVELGGGSWDLRVVCSAAVLQGPALGAT